MLPSIEISEGVEVYVSDQGTKPSSISEMIKLDGLKANKINAIYSNTRWIAVTNGDAYEIGLVTSPFNYKYDIINHNIVIDALGNVLFVDNLETILEW